MNDNDIAAMKDKRNVHLNKLDELLDQLLQLQDQVTVTLSEIEATRNLVAIYNQALTSAPRTP